MSSRLGLILDYIIRYRTNIVITLFIIASILLILSDTKESHNCKKAGCILYIFTGIFLFLTIFIANIFSFNNLIFSVMAISIGTSLLCGTN